MKKIVWLGVGLLVLGLPVWAEEAPGTGGEIAEADLNNKVNAVTFFPAPYVAYSRIQVDKALEAGLVKNNRMNLGYSGFTGYALNVPQNSNENENNKVYLLGGTKFGFVGPVVLGKLTVQGGSPSKNELFFSSTLRLADFCSGKNEDDSPCTASSSSGGVNGHPGYSINSQVLKVLCPNNVCNLKLFGKPFPVCSNNGSTQISWQMAALGSNPAQQELYLACGEYSDCSWWKKDTATEWYWEQVGGLMTPLNVQQMKCQAMTDPAPAQSDCSVNASTEPTFQKECGWRNNDGCYCKTWKWTCIHCGGQG